MLTIAYGIRTIYLHGLNKRFSLKFCVGSWGQHEKPKDALTEILWIYLNSVNDKNYQA